MTNLSELEWAALQCVAANYPDLEPDVGAVFRSCTAAKRQNTGGGFFTDLVTTSSICLPSELRSPMGDAWLSIKVMRFGICCLVFLTSGRPTLLEGYSVGGEDTSGIDFGSVVFKVRDAPPTGGDDWADAPEAISPPPART